LVLSGEVGTSSQVLVSDQSPCAFLEILQMVTIPERDWKRIRDLKDELLNVACEQIFQRIEKLSADRAGPQHKSYLELYNLIKKEDKAIADMFDGLSRNSAYFKIAARKRNGVLIDEQMALFSEETQAIVQDFCQFRR
jgi:hypothetical protein